MTIREIYANSCALTFTTAAEQGDISDFVIPHINLIFAENFKGNNQIRKSKGKTPLTAVPIAKTMDDEIVFEDELISALTYGLGANLLIADDDDMGDYYSAKYYAAIKDAVPLIEEKVVDVYATSDTE